MNSAGMEYAAMEQLCKALSIVEVHAEIYDNSEKEQLHIGQNVVLYHEENAKAGETYVCREVMEDGRIVSMAVMVQSGDERGEAQQQILLNLAKLLYANYSQHKENELLASESHPDGENGIYSTRAFHEKVQEMLDEGINEQYYAGFFNLKNFSAINDRFGRDGGDAVIRAFTLALKDMLSGEREFICKGAGDNFRIVFERTRFEQIKEYLTGHKLTWDEEHEEVWIAAVAGYCNLTGIQYPSEAIEHTDMAYDLAKHIQKVPYAFYDEKIHKDRQEEKRVCSLFPEAIDKEEFKVFYQPKVFLKDYSLVGAEALCRWYHDGEIIPPSQFIHILEKSKDICALDFYMLEHVCRDIRHWLDGGKTVPVVSVNFSRCHFGNMDLAKDIMKVIDKYHVPHEFIEVELTESTTDVDFRDLKRIVNSLQDHGVSASVDDFGTGYSSMNLLRQLPWNVIKIDQSFLRDRSGDAQTNNSMLKYVIAMAHEIGMSCIVEGVETPEHVKLLKENNCFYAQGFYFSKPMQRDDFEKLMVERGVERLPGHKG